MIPVLVETNWVVDVRAPSYRRDPAALALLDRAAAGELEVHVPAVALREAGSVIRRKHQPTQARVLRDQIAGASGVRVYGLSGEMLDRAPGEGPRPPALRRSDPRCDNELREHRPVFCTLDHDLAVLNRRGQARTEFVELYAQAGLTVRTDFRVPAA